MSEHPGISGDRPVALVTGGARRVGRAVCVELARRGCDVVLTYRSSGHEAASLVRELHSMGVGASAVRADFDDLEAVGQTGGSLASSLARLDVLVHNASVYEQTALDRVTAEDALRHYRVNALAPLLLTRDLAGLLRGSPMPGGAAVVAMCDMHAMGRPRKAFSAYSMSKAALAEMVRTLARELAPRVRVTGVAPGVVAFPESGRESDEAEQAAYLSRVPLGRSGTVEDAAAAVAWLALEASYVTGEVLRLDGGRWLA